MHFAVGIGLAHRARPFELEAVGVVDEAIEDGIGEGGIADEIVPGFDRQLTAISVEERPWRSSTISMRS